MDGINDILDGKFDQPLCLMFIIIAIAVLVFALIGLILKIAKVKARAKYYKFLSLFVSFAGVVGLGKQRKKGKLRPSYIRHSPARALHAFPRDRSAQRYVRLQP